MQKRSINIGHEGNIFFFVKPYELSANHLAEGS